MGDSRAQSWPHRLRRLLKVERCEWPALLWSFAYFFFILSGYYILRPLREEMGVASGVDNLQWLFTAVFLVMLVIVPIYGWITTNYPRRRFVPWVYAFFIANILVFYWFFANRDGSLWVARVFFVWVSVFNLFVVSVFWSFMADIFSSAQGKRLFGIIAAGGSAGAVTGPVITASLVKLIGVDALLLVSAALLSGAVMCVRRLIAWRHRERTLLINNMESVDNAEAIGGSILAGAKLLFQSRYLFFIAAFTVLGTMSGSILYFQQANIVSQTFDDPMQRTQLFALIDLSVNTLTIFTQVLLTSRIIGALGVAKALSILPVIAMLGMLILGFAPVLGVLAVIQVMRRAAAFSIAVPVVSVLYTVVTPEEKYKAKHFIDTVVYRAGDVVSGWMFTILKATGANLAGIAFFGAVLGLTWIGVASGLGRQFLRHPKAS